MTAPNPCIYLRFTVSSARHRDHSRRAAPIYGMLLAGIEPDAIAETLNFSAAELESQLWAMLRKLEAPRTETRFDRPSGSRGV